MNTAEKLEQSVIVKDKGTQYFKVSWKEMMQNRKVRYTCRSTALVL